MAVAGKTEVLLASMGEIRVGAARACWAVSGWGHAWERCCHDPHTGAGAWRM